MGRNRSSSKLFEEGYCCSLATMISMHGVDATIEEAATLVDLNNADPYDKEILEKAGLPALIKYRRESMKGKVAQ